jgi:hypothetical protein
MLFRFTLALAVLMSGPFVSTNAVAQTYDDLDGEQESRKPTKQKKQREVVREIAKGTYAKANVGSAIYLGQFAPIVSPGTSLGLAVGQDFLDHERKSMAWEVAFFQGINNAATYQEQAEVFGCYEIGTCIQGDLRTYTFVGLVEFSLYPTRRIGVGLRAGGGILFAPLLMNEEAYQTDVVHETWNDFAPTYHEQPHPVVMGGPTFEYYTKLSHLSIGLDVDIFYAVNFDLGMSITGAMKYTF